MGTRRSEEEKLLISKIQQKDTSALSTLYDRYQNLLFGIIVQIVKIKSESEDVLQEVFIKVWKNSHLYNSSKGTVFSWIVTIAKRTAIDRIRSKERRNLDKSLNIDEEYSLGSYTDDSQDSPQDVVESQQEKEAIKKALQEIPEEQRTIIIISYFEGKSHEEIAKLLNIPVGTVKSRIRLGMIKLQSILTKEMVTS